MNWGVLLERLRHFRKSNIAPVDTMGIEAIASMNPQVPRKVKKAKLSAEEKGIKDFHTLVGLMLSSQTNDKITSSTVYALIEDNGLTPKSVMKLSEKRLKELIGKVGFFNRKTEYLKKVSSIILEKYGGSPPDTYENLIALPGVGNKMAHLFLQVCHNKVEGISVDVHLHRIAHRWKWVDANCSTPDKTALGLQRWLPKKHWREINPLVVGFGQLMCTAQAPKCDICPLADLCPSVRKSTSHRMNKTVPIKKDRESSEK
ncbi:endonuclease III [Perkinsela sp. CCAP 1560/4]|nr:endonuclease III [Perkinsela sp. CCAP 1560/4]|eukprot:KNH09414.1 endonuclease III [Perkinsela sp. CCAP 1560/4]